jgi:hypothetical protein
MQKVCGKTEKLAADLLCYFLRHLSRKNVLEGLVTPLAKHRAKQVCQKTLVRIFIPERNILNIAFFS